jgi:hypothetical protein
LGGTGRVELDTTVADHGLESLLDGEVIEVADPGQRPADPGGAIGGEGDGTPAIRRGEGSFKGPRVKNAYCKSGSGHAGAATYVNRVSRIVSSRRTR